MTASNPFADRLRTAAQEGYVSNYRGFRREARPVRPFGVPAQLTNEPVFTAHLDRATEKQAALVTSLLAERDLTVEDRPKFRARVARLAADPREVAELSIEQASNLITYLFGLPMRPDAPQAPADVPAGHYAVIRDEKTVFVRVDRPLEGKWAGRVFVSLQHGDDYTNMSRAAGNTILGQIQQQGVLECSTRYGREIGRCGVCHRTLTNAESRDAGIGPVCREKSGW